MKRYYYRAEIHDLQTADHQTILGKLTENSLFSLEITQRDAWIKQIEILKKALITYHGTLYFEYTIPRMGRRVDVIAIIGAVIFIFEFKIGSKSYQSVDIDQTWDYALDLKNFHETSHEKYIVPVLIATKADNSNICVSTTVHGDKTFFPIFCNASQLKTVIDSVLLFVDGEGHPINSLDWENGRYHPTPTIIEAATALYNEHSVAELSRNDAGAINLKTTSNTISEIIQDAREQEKKSICFVTGVPGAGKTLVGLNIATKHINKKSELYSVFLSGNGPLVAILREALVRDKVARNKNEEKKLTKKAALSEVKMFIQNVHNFRDDCLIDQQQAPIEHVALFDEAQRAWNKHQTASFMKQKRKQPGFNLSEPEFLISCMDRHVDWAVIVCLVGGGQEINTGEAGIAEWVRSLQYTFPHWDIYLSNQLTDDEYGAGLVLEELKNRSNVIYKKELHLSVSMRSFRAENVSLLIKQILDCEADYARNTLKSIDSYPIVITRDLSKAKKWLKQMARGSERYGMIVSSQAERLKPHAIDVRPKVDPVHWFLNGKDDVRSSFFLEDVATEFHIQGLELDWTCVIWDADFRHNNGRWISKSFRGCKWINILSEERQRYLKNAYRVLLTRARQGMVIVIPPGELEDPTRLPVFYDSTYEYLKQLGFPVL